MRFMSVGELSKQREAVLPKLARFHKELEGEIERFKDFQKLLADRQTHGEYSQALERFAAAEDAKKSHPHDLDVQRKFREADADKEEIERNVFQQAGLLEQIPGYIAKESANFHRSQQRAEIEEQLEALGKLSKTLKEAEKFGIEGVSLDFDKDERDEADEIASALKGAKLLRAAGRQLESEVEMAAALHQGATYEDVEPEHRLRPAHPH